MLDLKSRIVSQRPLKAGYWAIELDARAIADRSRPGQFVHLRVPRLEQSALRRP